MARSKRKPSARPGQTEPRASRSDRRVVGLAVALAVVLAGAAVVAVLSWSTNDDAGGPVAEPGPVHVHGLGVNPADGALFVATHTGLFRAAKGDSTVVRVGDSYQDTMGFTIAGPDRFLGSGHPDLREDSPPLLGLIESTDAGKSWEPVSLLGESDFHTLRFAHGRVYGYDVTNNRLLMSGDQGRTWDELERPGPVVDLAVDPADPRHLVAASESPLGSALFESVDGGESWRATASQAGLLAWPTPDRLYVVTSAGEVFVKTDGRRLAPRGRAGGQPAALLADGGDLYVALHDGTIKRSVDGGRHWMVRSTP